MTEAFPSGVVVQPSQPVAPTNRFTKLTSGSRIAISSQPTTTATIKIAVRGGSSAESQAEKGAAVVLASAAFDGNAHLNGVAVMRQFEDIGAVVSARAGREQITYSISCGSERLQEALTLAVDNVKAPVSREWMIEHAKRRAAVQDTQSPGARVSEMLHEASFGENTPLGSSLYAPRLSALAASDVLHYRNALFASENVCVAVHGGSLSGDAVTKQLEGLLSTGLPSGKAATFSGGFSGGEMRVRDDMGGATRASLAFAAPAGNAGKAYEVLRAVLNGAVSSRGSHVQTHLHSQTHSYRSNSEWTDTFFNRYSTTGMVGVNLLGDAKYVSSGLEAFIAELMAVAGGQSTAESIEVAKKQLQLESYLVGEVSGADRLLASLVSGSAFETPLSESDYSGVTKEAVAAAAKACLQSTPGYAVLGATYQVPFLAGVAKMMK
jgi:predicted Zn-dependent peptidase